MGDKKDKKNKKRLKRGTKDKTAEKQLERSNTPPVGMASTTSISDVFADHLMQKAKQTLGEPVVMKTKSELNAATPSYDDGTNDDFDIPTISEIAKNAVEKVACRKEFTELEELQKKINQAKRQLRQITDESEDDDFINLRADKHDLDDQDASCKPIDSVDIENATSRMYDTAKSKSIKEPITFNPPQQSNNDTEIKAFDEKRRSIHDRLGNKPRKENIISLSTNRRVEQALYVPGQRRNEIDKGMLFDSDRQNQTFNVYPLSKTDADDELNRISRSQRDQNYVMTDLRQKVQTKRLTNDKSVHSSILKRVQDSSSSINKRIGSRVIVAPPRSKIERERKKDSTVSSVVNIQSRPVVPKSKQACKRFIFYYHY